MLEFADEISSRRTFVPPFFPQILLDDKILIQNYLQLFLSQELGISQLEKDARQLAFFSRLIIRHTQNRILIQDLKPNRTAVCRAVEFLDANFTHNISLAVLASVADVGKFYLCREFRRQIRVSPHTYQIQRRVAHAK